MELHAIVVVVYCDFLTVLETVPAEELFHQMTNASGQRLRLITMMEVHTGQMSFIRTNRMYIK